MQPHNAPFPAILLMGPPHRGKSVLGHWLTRELRRRGIAHFLLRTAPDGEGNWFHEGPPQVTVTLRLGHKGRYTPQLVTEMLAIIRRRHLPLLVDMGGKPRGEQRKIIGACTHGILLYGTPEERAHWHAMVAQENPTLRWLAQLHSTLDEPEVILQQQPFLEGRIRGLVRHRFEPGEVAWALLERVAEVLHYDSAALARYHAQTAPAAVLNEATLARALGKARSAAWQPAELPRLLQHISPQPWALYGPGPVWLAAAIAAHTAPHPLWLFDSHFGWVAVPEVVSHAPPYWAFTPQVLNLPRGKGLLVRVHLGEPFIPYGPVPWPFSADRTYGLVLSGKLPRWTYAAWARHVAPRYAWLAVYDPRFQAAVVVASRVPQPQVGHRIKLPST